MAEFIVSLKDKVLFRYPLEQGIIGIGRGSANEIHLNSPTVSDQHARVSLFEGACHIQNLAASGNTYVNGRETNRARLRHEDVLNIGHYKIIVRDPALVGSNSDAEPNRHDHSQASSEPIAPARQEAQDPPRGAEEYEIEREENAAANETHAHSPPRFEEIRPHLPEQDEGDGESRAPPPAGESSTQKLPASHQPGDSAHRSAKERATTSTTAAKTALSPAAYAKRRQSEHGLLSAGVDVLAGPAMGNRVYFSQQSATLGVGGESALEIKSVAEGYVLLAPKRDMDVRLNGESVTNSPAGLVDGDQVDFGNISVRFFVGN